jgi:hypothetical protein
MTEQSGGSLPRGVEAELNLFAIRLRDAAERLNQQRPRANRINDVAVLAVEFWDMLDSIDHLTSMDGSGTSEIQTLAREGREKARQLDTPT